MRLLFIGDVVGRAGRAVLLERLPDLRRRWKLDFVVVNSENAAGGFGITEAIADEFLAAGADCLTLGNHSFDQREALVFIERQERLIRPVNYPPGTPGRGSYLYEGANGHRVLVCNVMGRVFMDPLDDPFAAIEREVSACPLGLACDAAIFDVHAEASSEKQAIGHFLDGRVSLVVGTHTHVPTADERVLPGGTAIVSVLANARSLLLHAICHGVALTLLVAAILLDNVAIARLGSAIGLIGAIAFAWFTADVIRRILPAD